MNPSRHNQQLYSGREESVEYRGSNPIMIKVIDDSYHASFGLFSTVQKERLNEETSVRLDAATENDLYDDAMELLYCHRRRKVRLGDYAFNNPSNPEGSMNRASLVALSADDRKSSGGGKFLEMLSTQQSSNNGNSNSSLGFLIRQAQTMSAVSKLRLSIIPSEAPPVVIDFDSDKDYWFMLSAIKRAIGWLTNTLHRLSIHSLIPTLTIHSSLSHHHISPFSGT